MSFTPRLAPMPTIITRAAGMPQDRPRRYSTAREATVTSEDMTAGGDMEKWMDELVGCQRKEHVGGRLAQGRGCASSLTAQRGSPVQAPCKQWPHARWPHHPALAACSGASHS